MGNIAVQAIAQGEIKDVAQAREVIRNSFEISYFEPHDADMWDEGYERLVNSLYSASEASQKDVLKKIQKKLLNTAAVIPVWSESTYFVCTQDARGVIALPGEENLYLFNATDVK